MRPTTAQLEALVAVARAGSISEASRQLGLAQPTVSATLNRLERTAGVPLLHRDAAGTRLTQEGEAIHALAIDALTHLDNVGTALSSLRGAPNPVRIAASYTIAEQLLPIWLAGCPVATLVEVCNSSKVQERVLGNRAECGFVEGARIDTALSSWNLGKDELVLVVGARHPWARRTSPVDARELVRPTAAGTLVVREAGSGAREVLETELLAHGVALPSDTRVLGSTSAQLTAVRHLGAHAIVAHKAAEELIRLGKITRVPVHLDLMRDLTLVLPRNRMSRASVLTVVEHTLRARRTGDPASAVRSATT